MFVRFKRRKLSRDEGYSLHSVLVESYRSNGKPRQRFVCYLGSIREEDLGFPLPTKELIGTVNNRIEELNLHPQVSSQLKISFVELLQEYLKTHDKTNATRLASIR